MAKNSKFTGREERHQKKDISNVLASKFVWQPTYQHLASCFVFIPSVFGEKFATAEF
jgi:hypothetical protein